jgi:hypothetical protein
MEAGAQEKFGPSIPTRNTATFPPSRPFRLPIRGKMCGARKLKDITNHNLQACTKLDVRQTCLLHNSTQKHLIM